MTDEQETTEAARTGPADPAFTGAPQQIGPYKVLGLLGEGGFGVVYLAEQSSPVRRRVALKIIKLGMDSKQVVARFEAERQALAMMDHPHVAKVLDAGTTEAGRPYFVMEHVAGISITEHCDRQRLTIEERLDLFTRVCEAVQHAHQKGIIHRDLKPSNILVSDVDGASVPRVIDFGVAKALHQRLTEQTLYTGQGQLVGTPEYMSPEQAEMTAQDIDTRSDIYSLGVLLYELLTGERPFSSETLRQAGLAEIQRIIREQEPPKPSTRSSDLEDGSSAHARSRRTDPRTLARRLRGDLDWITMKALAKSRAERYASATELALDIRRHLDREPVEAGPPTASYRFRKFVIRHRGLCALVLVVFALLAAGIGIGNAVVALRFSQVEHAMRDYMSRNVVSGALRLADIEAEIGRRNVQFMDYSIAPPRSVSEFTADARSDRALETLRKYVPLLTGSDDELSDEHVRSVGGLVVLDDHARYRTATRRMNERLSDTDIDDWWAQIEAADLAELVRRADRLDPELVSAIRSEEIDPLVAYLERTGDVRTVDVLADLARLTHDVQAAAVEYDWTRYILPLYPRRRVANDLSVAVAGGLHTNRLGDLTSSAFEGRGVRSLSTDQLILERLLFRSHVERSGEVFGNHRQMLVGQYVGGFARKYSYPFYAIAVVLALTGIAIGRTWLFR